MKTILVTGANRGIGLGFVKQLLAEGNRVFAACRNPDEADTFHELEENYGEAFTPLELDVTDEKSMKFATATVGSLTATLDLLINNAGVMGGKGTLSEVTADDMVETFRINAVGPLLVAQTFLPFLEKGSRPFVVNISSLMGSMADNGGGGWYAYRTSKAALNMITTNMAVELKTQGVGVIAFSPGWVQTDMGGSGASISVEDSVADMLETLANLTLDDTGRFLGRKGDELPW